MIAVCFSALRESLKSPLSRRPARLLEALLPKVSAPAAGSAARTACKHQNPPASSSAQL